MTAKITHLNANDIIKDYSRNISILELARIYGVSRRVITRVLKENWIDIRGKSEAQFIRNKKMTREERMVNTKNAHDARRGQKDSLESLEKRAKTNNGRIGMFELETIEYLEALGVSCEGQYAIGKYSIDIFINKPLVAIEIYASHQGIKRATDLRERSKYLLNSGINLMNINTGYPNRTFIMANVCSQIIAFIDFCSRNQSPIGHNLMIRGNGDISTIPCHYLDDFPPVERL